MHPHVAEKHRNAKIPYEIKASILGIILFTVSAFMIFQILKEFFYASSFLMSVISPSEKIHIYIYDSYTNERFLESVGVSRNTYRKRLKKLESWMLKDLDLLPEIIKTDEVIKEAFDVASLLALSKDEQFAYMLDQKAILDYKNTIDYAKETAMEEGLREGLEKGLKQGLEQGIQKGLEQGKKEGEKEAKIKIAKNGIDKGLDIETIVLLTGLTYEEIQKLKG